MMEARDLLYGYADAMARVGSAAEELAEMLTVAPASPGMDGMPHGGGVGRPVEALAVRTDALEERLRQAWKDADRARADVEAVIAGARVSETHREVLRARYLHLDPRAHGRRAVRSLQTVALTLGLSESYTRALHAEALRAIEAAAAGAA